MIQNANDYPPPTAMMAQAEYALGDAVAKLGRLSPEDRVAIIKRITLQQMGEEQMEGLEWKSAVSAFAMVAFEMYDQIMKSAPLVDPKPRPLAN